MRFNQIKIKITILNAANLQHLTFFCFKGSARIRILVLSLMQNVITIYNIYATTNFLKAIYAIFIIQS